MKDAAKVQKLYQTQWRVYFKRGLGQPSVVYGETEEEALRNALAFFRKDNSNLEMWPREQIVDHVEFIG